MSRLVHTQVIIVGAGQAGLSLSRVLKERGVEHVVLERGRVGESWRSQRWDSFCLVTPNWTVRLAGAHYAGDDPHGFMGKAELIEFLEQYAAGAVLPIETQTRVVDASHIDGTWQVVAENGRTWTGQHLVVATATHQIPRFPRVKDNCTDVHHVHAADYRNPAALPVGDVLVVGSGQSGVQIADELARAGRNVTLATSQVGRIPRRYRGRDVIEWQAEMGFLDRHADALDSPQDRFRADPMLSGRDGGRTMDLRELAHRGITLAGKLEMAGAGILRFADDLHANLQFADAFNTRFERTVDALIERRAFSAPPAEPGAAYPLPSGIKTVNTGPGAVEVIVWATGFDRDLSWLRTPAPLDSCGYPQQRNWYSGIPGLHFLGFNYLERRRSGILYGAGVEAHGLARTLLDNR